MPIGTPSVPYRLPGSQYERYVDIYTRLAVERILFLGQGVDDAIANNIVAQMLYLDSDDNSKPIYRIDFLEVCKARLEFLLA